MQKPQHISESSFRTPQSAQKRALSVGIVVALHLVVLWALASGLAGKMTAHLIQDVKVAVVKEKPPDLKPPPPPPPDFKVPPPDFVPPPEINIAMESMANAISQVQQKVATVTPPPPVTVVTPPRAMGRGHECESQYPPLSRRLSEQGVVRVKFTVTAEGTVAGPSVVKSSGFQRLDEAAIQCTSRWRYHPAQRNGQPVAVGTEANIRYQLR